MGRIVKVVLGERSYDIHVGRGLSFGSMPRFEGAGILIVSDSNVMPLYGDLCRRAVVELGGRVSSAVVPAGEASKDLTHAAELYAHAIGAGLDRRSAIVALGGGMVGDLAGFVAATFMRGVRLIQVPTTLLAMVDSSVGGKTAVNLPEGKNLVGAFHQPIVVASDLDTLKSLPDREYLSGMAEVIKYGVIWDAVLFERLEKSVDALKRRDPEFLEQVVARCCEIKAEIVGMDERESGVRAILNFGHTAAHALETAAGHGSFLHGEAVAVGMVFAAAVSCAVKGFGVESSRRLKALLAATGLPTSHAGLGLRAGWEEIRRLMGGDKKSQGGAPRMVLAERLGSVAFGCEVDEKVMAEAWRTMAQSQHESG